MTIRAATGEDLPFLRAMLYEAACWRPGAARPPIDAVLAEPTVERYLRDWPRPGDAGVMALDDAAEPIGAAWYRLFPSAEPGYGFLDDSIPEVTIGVAAGARGRGAGTALLSGLIDLACAAGLAALCLSVERDNLAARLYKRCGFAIAREEPGGWVMRLDLSR